MKPFAQLRTRRHLFQPFRHQLEGISTRLLATVVPQGSAFHPARLVHRKRDSISTCLSSVSTSRFRLCDRTSKGRSLRGSTKPAANGYLAVAVWMTSLGNRSRIANEIRAHSAECRIRFFRGAQEFVPEVPVMIHGAPPASETGSLT